MNHGPLLFLGILAAMATSWCSFIVAPQLQIGAQDTKIVDQINALYPTPRLGLAEQGRAVYVANGCQYCHTQQVRQDDFAMNLVLKDPGTNAPALITALRAIRRDLSEADAVKLTDTNALPAKILERAPLGAFATARKKLNDSGATVDQMVVPLGTDMARGWGVRQSVAQDYLYERPVLLGSQRIGPDLANAGVRQTNEVWHLLHLFNPRLTVPTSTMPRYSFLFEKRKVRDNRPPSSDRLQMGEGFAGPGNEIVPTHDAHALTAYLISLRQDVPLFEAPMPFTPLATPATNAPAATTNSPAQ